jgi:hypothetical protein
MVDPWTIIFVTLLAIAFAVAAWLDRKEKKRRDLRGAACETRSRGGEPPPTGGVQTMRVKKIVPGIQ